LVDIRDTHPFSLSNANTQSIKGWVSSISFEALSQFSEEEKQIARALLDSLILKHTANRLAAGSGH